MKRLCLRLAALALLTPAPHALRFLGRVNPSTQELSWPATGLEFSFNGTLASVSLAGLWGNTSIEMVIDRGPPIITDNVAAGTSRIDTPANLSQGLHTVEIRKKSEALYGSIYIGNVTAPGGAILSSAAATTRARRIQIIGDSISVGYGLDGTYPCVNSAALEDAEKTYGALAAQNLSADYDIVAWSGKGILRNYPTGAVDNTPVMPQLWTRYGANDADGSYTFPRADIPDIVVVNLGTNDFDYMLTNASGQLYQARQPLDPSTYTAALVSFTTTIQGHYPDAHFFLTTSPLLSDGYPLANDTQHTTQANCIKAAVEKIGSNAHFVDFPTQDSSNNNIGCDYHPSASTHQSMAVIFTAAIKEALPSMKRGVL